MAIWAVIVILLIILIVGLVIYNQYYFLRAEHRFPPTGDFVIVDGIKLHYVEYGEGRPVVMLHGGVLWGADFDQAMRLAADNGYRVLAFDRPGYGYSYRPDRSLRSSSEPTPFMQARLIHAALEQLGVQKPIMVGHSYSGLLVMIYAHLFPKHVSGLVTLAGGMYKEGYPAASGDPLFKLVTMPLIGELVLHTLPATLGRLMARNVLRATFAPDPVPDHYADAVMSLWLRPSQFKANREDVVDFVPAAELVSNHYKDIDTPTIIVKGARDPFPTKVHSDWLHQTLPNSELIELQDASHMIPHTHPAAVVHALQKLTDKNFVKSADVINVKRQRPESEKKHSRRSRLTDV